MSIDVGPVADFEERRFRIVNAGGHELGVLRWQDRFFAVHNRCPHQKGPLCLGIVSGRLVGRAPGSMEVDDDVPVIACPWHGWEFDLERGRALWEEGYAAKVVPVRVERGRVLVDVGRSARDPAV
ncbi:MAG TPA: Rieske 2Fe-2S domain-containing protein [Candidatus Micrarchaeaceae archaeon]|nr:Rieske 2Fe-2S domain-containing protein [Candidatus Micrarchaeaceae archaeon]